MQLKFNTNPDLSCSGLNVTIIPKNCCVCSKYYWKRNKRTITEQEGKLP